MLKHQSKSWMSWFVADFASAILNTVIYKEITSSRTKITTTSDQIAKFYTANNNRVQWMTVLQSWQQRKKSNGLIRFVSHLCHIVLEHLRRDLISPCSCVSLPANALQRCYHMIRLYKTRSKCSAKMVSYDKTRSYWETWGQNFEKAWLLDYAL